MVNYPCRIRFWQGFLVGYKNGRSYSQNLQYVGIVNASNSARRLQYRFNAALSPNFAACSNICNMSRVFSFIFLTAVICQRQNFPALFLFCFLFELSPCKGAI
jgi:hypothetical protein